jgi:exosome complex exonuclease RRP6
MFFYARADTHFLLYIYDHMRNELIDRTKSDVPDENRIEIVLQKSKETSLLRYERQVYNLESGRGPGGWYSLLVKTPALFSNEQFAVFRAVHGWRDKVARADDDSTTFVMSQQVLFSIAKLMPLDMVALLSIAHPVSHGVKSRAGELLDIIKNAKAEGPNGPSMLEVLRPDTAGTTTKNKVQANGAKAAIETFEGKSLVAVVDEGDLRSGNSTFWGGAFGSSIWDVPSAVLKKDDLRLAVPLPALSSEIFASRQSSQLVVSSPPKEEKHAPLLNDLKKEEEAFTIKRGSKRKSEVMSDEEASDGEGSASEKSVRAQEKAERKAARKAEKKAKKAAKKALQVKAEDNNDVVADAEDMEMEEPFDYSKAESVLHGKPSDMNKGSSKKKKPMDPYAKSTDAPKGARRLQTERAGKSHTFKN